VVAGRHGGYVAHGFNRGGRGYERRTYYRDGHAYTRVYGRGYYHGYYYNHYYPGYYYGGGYYGYAYGGWANPVAWSWGWGASPWYGYYGYYFNPYPVYAAPAFWLTDYIISANLQAAYAAAAVTNAEAVNAAAANANAAAANANAAAANANAGGGYQQQAPAQDQGNAAPAQSSQVILTPEVKQAIADEVKAEILAEQQASQQTGPQAPQAPAAAPAAATPASDTSSADADAPVKAPAGTPEVVPDALNPNNRTFIVADAITPDLPDGTQCSLTQGDVLTRIEDTPDANASVKVLVSGSQKSDCHSGTQLSVKVNDLQEMHNHFREQIDDGLGEMAKKQGTGGMPAAPAGTTTAKANAEGTAQPDLTAQSDIEKTSAQADTTEKEVQVAANEGAGS
jgi:hypothetical protein